MNRRQYMRQLPQPVRKREYVLMAAAMSLALFAAYGGDIPEDRVLPMIPAPAGFRCTPTQDDLRLRLAVRHCPDGIATARWCQHSCWYGSIERRDWQ